jgi:hypothetical protein
MTIETTTPRTDAAYIDTVNGKTVPVEFARTLERDRAALIAALVQVLDASEDGGNMEDIDWSGIRETLARGRT